MKNTKKQTKKNGRKIQLPAAKKTKKKLKLQTKETVLPVYNLSDFNTSNDDTTYTVSEASTYTTTVNVADNTVITTLPNKEELYSKYTEAEQTEEPSYPNAVVPKANNDGLNTVIIIAGALAVIAFIALMIS